MGLLFDLYANKEELPWSITLHFKDLPTGQLLLRPTPENMQDIFMSMIKEVRKCIRKTYMTLIDSMTCRPIFYVMAVQKKVMNLSKKRSNAIMASFGIR